MCMTDELLPGEGAPLPRRLGGRPLTDDEVLGVARRLARGQARGADAQVPEELPDPAQLVQAAFRLPSVSMMRLRARAELEGRTSTSVIRELIEGYGTSAPGTVATFELPPSE